MAILNSKDFRDKMLSGTAPQSQQPGILSSVGGAAKGLLGALGSGGSAFAQSLSASAPQMTKDILDAQRFYQMERMKSPGPVLASQLGQLNRVTPAGVVAGLPQYRAAEQAAIQKPLVDAAKAQAGLLAAQNTAIKSGLFGGVGKEGFDVESKLRREFDLASVSYKEALKGFNQVKAAARAKNPTGADDVALVFGFMKTIDPGSVVREGEFATAENTAGVPTRVRAAYNKLIDGDRLDPIQREYFLGAARNQFVALQAPQRSLENRYFNLSEDYNIEPGRIITKLSETFEDITPRTNGDGTYENPIVVMSEVDGDALPPGTYYKVGVDGPTGRAQ